MLDSKQLPCSDNSGHNPFKIAEPAELVVRAGNDGMPLLAATPIRLRIDGVWQECQPADDLGFLGARYVCNLGSASGQAE